MNQSEISNRRAPQFGIFFSLRRLYKSSRIARKEEGLQDFPAEVRRTFRLVQLLQLAGPMNQTELTNRFASQRFILLALRRDEQTLVIASYHVAAKDSVLHRGVTARGVNVGQRLARFRAAEEPQIFDRLALQVWVGLSSRNSAQNLACLRRPALCQHEKGLPFFFGRSRAVNHFLEQGQRAFGIAAPQPLNREHFQFLVTLV